MQLHCQAKSVYNSGIDYAPFCVEMDILMLKLYT